MHVKTAIGALGLALSLPATALADGNTGTITGKVRLSDGRPVCGLRVVVQSEREATWTAFTDRDGAYVFLAVFPGDVSVRFPTLLPTVDRRAHVSPNLSTTVDATAERHLRAYVSPAGRAAMRERCPASSYAVPDFLTPAKRR